MSLLSPDGRAAKPPLLILAVGNPSRGDDAIGPLMASQLQDWLAQQDASLQARVDVVSDLQLMVEHVFDIQGRARVLFIDASAQSEQTGARLLPIQASVAPVVNSHASSPAQLLGLHQSLLGAPPPSSHLLTISGHSFELGAPLSPQVQASLSQAWALLQGWLKSSPPPGCHEAAPTKSP